MTATQIRTCHKWFALITAIQLLFWLATGAYMVWMDIEFIRGKPLVNKANTAMYQVDSPAFSFTDFIKAHPDATDISLYANQGALYYRANIAGKLQRFSSETGEVLPLLDKQQALEAAQRVYTGQAKFIGSTFIEQNAPSEIPARVLPVWQLTLDDAMHSTLYISAVTGQVVSARHDYWRLFDVMWMLHIMDYETRENVHNPLLTLMTSLALLTALFGIALTYISFRNQNPEEAV
ncbi:peptidase [Shewanella mangrovisoli]|uniref:peptidase n=1 Tax=Shewanella mangrovisoli TaxID=2864211 RepID=UPI001C65F637|nr:peptidase [Shewanella mangrovisoli]QYK08827.1 peptidase [Shewanella mangrovisoli]